MASPRAAKAVVWHRWVLRLAVSACVLAAIFWMLPLGDVLATIHRTRPSQWLATLAIFMAGHVISAFKWHLLANSGAPFPAVARAHFGGLVANLWLPGVAGGDVVRAGLLYKLVADKPRLALGSVADRLVDTFGLLLVAAVGLLVAMRQRSASEDLLVWVLAGLIALAIAALMPMVLIPFVAGRLEPQARLRRILEKIGAGLAALTSKPLRLVVCLALSVLVQIAFVAANVMLAVTAGVHAPLAAWFFAWPLSKIIATLPISVGGLGVREASLAGFLAPFGADPAAVVATGLLWQTILLAGGLIGALTILLATRGDRRAGIE